MLSSRMTTPHLRRFIDNIGEFIVIHQLPSGAIPWYQNGLTDPWDHVECAIALDMCGMHDPATKAYRWLAEMQNPDGSWWYTYQDNQRKEPAKDTNHSAYVATGVWLHYLFTRDRRFLREMWPVVEKGIGFTLSLQQPTGEIYWALDYQDVPWPSAPLTGSSCICQSITSAMKIARTLGYDRPEWERAARRLARAIRERPELFDFHGDNRRGYAMNWYYPVLTGMVSGDEARQHIAGQWPEFVVDGWGCKCSLDEPWVTVAETCELAMALVSIGETGAADTLLDWVLPLQDADGGFWTGIRVPEEIIYPPDEKTTWTAAGVILAVLADSEATLLNLL
jgi:hypothetical protein